MIDLYNYSSTDMWKKYIIRRKTTFRQYPPFVDKIIYNSWISYPQVINILWIKISVDKIIKSENTNIISDIYLACNDFKKFIHKTLNLRKIFSTGIFYV
ncbi:hypothetical protein BCI9360_01159 [Bacillus sp. CECT 9360]|nr:hypothetical protein BCI9360_01159 [Bacillus sp. CECT 9360]